MPPKLPIRRVSPLETVYPADFYDETGIARCSKCREKKRTIPGVGVICPQKDSDCPMLPKSSGGDSSGDIQPTGTVADPISTGDSIGETGNPE